jgi:hypothetical protein
MNNGEVYSIQRGFRASILDFTAIRQAGHQDERGQLHPSAILPSHYALQNIHFPNDRFWRKADIRPPTVTAIA